MSGPDWRASTLDCDHCGEDAIYSENGLFTDGDGDACMTCGFPGYVTVDEDEDEDYGFARWALRDGNDDVCSRLDCTECAPFRETASVEIRSEEP